MGFEVSVGEKAVEKEGEDEGCIKPPFFLGKEGNRAPDEQEAN